MIRKKNAVEDAAGGQGMPDATFMKDYPSIAAYLSDPVWDDGTPRELSTLSISVDDGQIRLALNDKDGRQSAYTNALSVKDAFKALEQALAKDLITWRAWDRKKGKKA